MRLLIILLVVIFAAAGAIFGALNAERITLDFYFAVAQWPKGATLIAALLLGWLIGGIVVYFGLVLRLRRRVRVLARELRDRETLVEKPPVEKPVVETQKTTS